MRANKIVISMIIIITLAAVVVFNQYGSSAATKSNTPSIGESISHAATSIDPLLAGLLEIKQGYLDKGETVPQLILDKIAAESSALTAASEKLIINNAKLESLSGDPIYSEFSLHYGFDPRPSEEIRIFTNLDRGEVYGVWEAFFGVDVLDDFDYSSYATPPYNALLSGCERKNPSVGVILNKVSPPDSFESYHERLTYPGKGKIVLEGFAGEKSMIVLFSYDHGKKGYFNTEKNEAFFVEYKGE